MQINNELVKTFLNIEKSLIDFRINQIDNGSVSYVNQQGIDKEELRDLIVNTVREEVRNILGTYVANNQAVVENVPTEVIAEKVMETSSIKEVAPEEVPELPKAEKVKVDVAKVVTSTSKGGSAFKIFEPLNIASVTQNLPNNSVQYVTKDETTRKAEVIKTALS